MARPTWTQTWLKQADAIAQRSLCVRAQVGAVVVSMDNRVVSTGYNGPPAGLMKTDACSGWCERAQTNAVADGKNFGLSCPTVHAEQNALIRADFIAMRYGTLYVTRVPCQDCVKLISNSGISCVVFRITEADKAYDVGATLQFMDNCQVAYDVVSEGEHA